MGYVSYSSSCLVLCRVSLHTNHSDGQMRDFSDFHLHLASNSHSSFMNILLHTPENCLAEMLNHQDPDSSCLGIILLVDDSPNIYRTLNMEFASFSGFDFIKVF